MVVRKKCLKDLPPLLTMFRIANLTKLGLGSLTSREAVAVVDEARSLIVKETRKINSFYSANLL